MTADSNSSEILLESGTNELEVLVFTVGQSVFGVNVAKVREVITPVPVVVSPHQPEAVIGMFNLRGKILPLVDLHDYLKIKPIDDDDKNRRIIVTEFNGTHAGFRVEKVEQIYRMSWECIRPVPDVAGHDDPVEVGENHFAITGIAEFNERLILMLDFESIIDDISVQQMLHVDKVENTLGVDRESSHILVAEDSVFIRDIQKRVLANSGYIDVVDFDNGRSAWEHLEEAAKGGDVRLPDAIVADIEMPRMDGLALTKRIKQHPVLGEIPVILFSSLITDDTRHKGSTVGADIQIAKPQIAELVSLVDRFIHERAQATQGAA